MRSFMSTTQPYSATPGPGCWAIGWLRPDVERRTHQSLSDLPAYRKPVHPLDRSKSGFPSNHFQEIESALSAPDRRSGNPPTMLPTTKRPWVATDAERRQIQLAGLMARAESHRTAGFTRSG